MKTAADIIREVSVDLNDYNAGGKYVRWPVAQLQTYLREALIDVSVQLRDLFIERVTVKLQSGGGWQVACDCTSILRIVGEVTADGELLRYLSRSLDIEENTWAGPVQRCRVSPKDYVMTGYTTSAVDDKEFRVSPPVPPGVTKYVLVECYKRPDGELNGSVPDEAEAMIKQWMLYRALSIDSENNPSIIELAATHQKTYFNLLQAAVLKREMEKMEDGNRGVRAVQKSTPD